ncbi:MAG TPA: MFS transporter, partial [Actinobacteria bacterium]|nr:MFS transporter [Actinomycetota bacterium]
ALSLLIAPISLGLIGFGQQGSYGTGATVIMRTAPPDMLGSVGTIKPVMGQLG